MAQEHSFWDPFPEIQRAKNQPPSFQSETTWQEWENRTDMFSLAVLAWIARYIGWTISLVFHAALALVLAYIILQAPFNGDAVTLDTTLASEELGGDFSHGPSLTDPQIGGAPLELAALVKEAAAPNPMQPLAVANFVPTSPLKATGVNSLGGNGTGKGDQDGNGTGGQVEFFGTRGVGNSVVFVVDMSGSMQQDHRFPIAQKELIQSINKLQKHQRFYVIFYNMRELLIFAPRSPLRMITATPSLKTQAKDWINTVRPGGGTEPRGALEQALKLHPDMIYFLTDGEIPTDTRDILMKANQSRVTIHTIAFQSIAGQEIMKQIAADHHGTFRFVP